MTDFQIKLQSQSTRCEICHQADFFDPENNCCLRCKNIPLDEKENKSARQKKRVYQNKNSKHPYTDTYIIEMYIRYFLYVGLFIGAVSGVVYFINERERVVNWFLGIIVLACFHASVLGIFLAAVGFILGAAHYFINKFRFEYKRD